MVKKNNVLKALILYIITISFFIVPKNVSAITSSNIQRYWHNGHLYALVDDSSSFVGIERFKEYSKSLGGHLAYIESYEENKFIANLTYKYGNRIFYGLGIHRSPEGWKYDNGENIVYSNWHPDEPNNKVGYENYVEMLRGSEGLWNDIPDIARVQGTTGAVIEWDVNDSIFRIEGASSTIKEGETIDLDINFSNKEDMKKILFNLSYNTDLLKLEKATALSGLNLLRCKVSNGNLSSILVSSGTSIESGKVLRLTFKAISKGSTEISFKNAKASKDGVLKSFDKYDCLTKIINVN